ncbi:MAG: hypothetical protein DRJ50_15105, partial [Actinobacteria bacterium]
MKNDDDEIERLLAWLDTIAGDPARLADLEDEQLRRLREATGRISFPERHDRRALAAKRKQVLRERVRRHDDAALNATSNRSRQRALRFPVAPKHLDIAVVGPLADVAVLGVLRALRMIAL